MNQVAIYGAGSYGRAFLRAMQTQGVTPEFFVDQYCGASQVMGLPVYRMDEVPNSSATVYVSVALTPTASDPTSDIVANLHGAGINSVRGFEEGLREFPSVLPEIFSLGHLWMSGEQKTRIDDEKVRRFRALLADDTSRELLDRIVEFRKNPSAETYVPPDGHEEYFPDDLDLFSNLRSIRFIDCGAYTGDTVVALASHLESIGKPLDYSISFEPDEDNHATLVTQLSQLKPALPAAHLMAFPQGVWSDNTVLSFDTGNGSSSAISSDATDSDVVKVPVVALDRVFGSASPNFIKMDVEGAEREAILGARDIIRDQSPTLAICVYHKPADLWELPLLIHELNPAYRMHLRAHSHMGLSTVLYCRA